MEPLTDEGLKVCQPQGPGLTDRVGLAPAADARRAGFDRQPYARRPPPPPGLSPGAPPPPRGLPRVRPPPTGGEGKGAPVWCESASPFGRGFAPAAPAGLTPAAPGPGTPRAASTTPSGPSR